MGSTGERPSVPLDGLVKAVIGYAGLAMCLTLVFLGMRAVMDIGGSCASGGPYVVATSCPEGSTIALLGGIFLGFGFAILASIGGIAVGGVWAAAPLLAWSGLFGSLGWNFLDYGVFSAPPELGIDFGWALCGVLFWIMAFGPLLGVIPAMRSTRSTADGSSRGSSIAGSGRPSDGRGSGEVTVLRGPGQPGHRPVVIDTSGSPVTTVSRDGRTITYSSTVLTGDDVPDALRAQLETLGQTLAEARASGQTEASHEQLAAIAADFGAAIGAAVARTPIGEVVLPGDGPPVAGAAHDHTTAAGAGPAAAEPEFTEGTQALLDRLERLADMRDRGLLGAEEYETAKAAIMAELEGRS